MQQFFQVIEVVVAENRLVAARLAHALDHRIVVQRIGEDQAVGDQLGDGRDAGLVRNVARGEDEGRLLAVEIGEFRFEVHDGVAVAGDVAGAAGAGAEAPGGFHHGAGHVPVLAHAEIVVGAPDRDGPGPRGAVPDRIGKPAGQSLDIGEDAVAPLGLKTIEGRREKVLIIHHLTGWATDTQDLDASIPGIGAPLTAKAAIATLIFRLRGVCEPFIGCGDEGSREP